MLSMLVSANFSPSHQFAAGASCEADKTLHSLSYLVKGHMAKGELSLLKQYSADRNTPAVFLAQSKKVPDLL